MNARTKSNGEISNMNTPLSYDYIQLWNCVNEPILLQPLGRSHVV